MRLVHCTDIATVQELSNNSFHNELLKLNSILYDATLDHFWGGLRNTCGEILMELCAYTHLGLKHLSGSTIG
jgi:hypothetical protein